MYQKTYPPHQSDISILEMTISHIEQSKPRFRSRSRSLPQLVLPSNYRNAYASLFPYSSILFRCIIIFYLVHLNLTPLFLDFPPQNKSPQHFTMSHGSIIPPITPPISNLNSFTAPDKSLSHRASFPVRYRRSSVKRIPWEVLILAI